MINKDSRIIFQNFQLEDDEIPKIFSFLRFNEKNVKGNFDQDPLDEPVLSKDSRNNLVDKDGNRVNKKGYLIDK